MSALHSLHKVKAQCRYRIRSRVSSPKRFNLYDLICTQVYRISLWFVSIRHNLSASHGAPQFLKNSFHMKRAT